MRNIFYETGLLRSSKFNIPIISIGNLSIGGAGKTPHIEYLIELLKPYLFIGTLSRGYKRQTRGFKLVEFNSTALEVGDEPLQFKRKYMDIGVAVSESRALGIPSLLSHYPFIKCILLDDAFQHRAVKPDVNILLTEYSRPFTRDSLLPSGRLREKPSSYKRADIIIVTKCPQELETVDQEKWIEEIKPLSHQKLFFTRYKYYDVYNFFDTSKKLTLNENYNVILISAIANTDYLYSYINNQVSTVIELEYEDHHNFKKLDIEYIEKVFRNTEKDNVIIVTTEKDAMRLDLHRKMLWDLKLPLYILPIKVQFLNNQSSLFEDEIKQFLIQYEA